MKRDGRGRDGTFHIRHQAANFDLSRSRAPTR